MSHSNARSGFTVVELMIVLTLIGLTFVLAFPKFQETRRTNNLYTEARKLSMDIKLLRELAYDRQAVIRLSFSADYQRYVIAYGPSGSEVIEKTVYLQNGVKYAATLVNHTLEINTEGMIVGGAKTITLESGGRRIHIHAKPGGRVEIQWP